jgi:hypothetical protein
MIESYRFVYLKHKEKEFLQKLSNFPLRGHPRVNLTSRYFRAAIDRVLNMPHRLDVRHWQAFLEAQTERDPGMYADGIGHERVHVWRDAKFQRAFDLVPLPLLFWL